MNFYFFFLSMFFGFICRGQMSKRDQYVSCRIKEMKTYCLEKRSEIISQIPKSPSGNIFGRFEDFREELSLFQMEQLKQDIKWYSKDSMVYRDGESIIQYSYNDREDRGFYYLHTPYYRYKGTVKNPELPEFSRYNSASRKNYLIFYNRKEETHPGYEAFHHIINGAGKLIYTFHQHENEFDEYTYREYDESGIKYIEENPEKKTRIYKNGKLYSVIKISGDYRNGNRKKIKTFRKGKSCILNAMGTPVLAESKFSNENSSCDCKKGFITKIRYQPEDECERQIIYD